MAVADEPVAAAGELPDPVDPRQLSLLGAAWTAGSVKYLAHAGVSSLTYFETTGWRGVLERESGSPLPERFRSRPGEPFPLYHLLRDLGELRTGSLLDCDVTDPLAAVGLGIRRRDATTLLVANLRPDSQTMRIDGLESRASIRRLNQETAAQAGACIEEFRRQPEPLEDARALKLLPYEIARIDAY